MHPASFLVEQRLEQMEAPAIDERDLDRRAPKTADGLESAEAPADDDHLMSAIGVAHDQDPRLRFDGCMIESFLWLASRTTARFAGDDASAYSSAVLAQRIVPCTHELANSEGCPQL